MNSERLLNVARALRESPNPDKFSMLLYGSDGDECGTPACAFGHYAYRTDLQDEFILDNYGRPRRRAYPSVTCHYYSWLTCAHFGITDDEAEELFSSKGCGCALTAIQAAEYIEKFVQRKLEGQL